MHTIATAVRQSHIGSADICLRRLQYDLDPTLPEGASEARIIGTSYHGGLEAYYKGRQQGELIPMHDIADAAYEAFDKAIPEGWSNWATDFGTARSKVQAMLEAYFDPATDAVWPYDHEILSVEWRFDLQVPNTDLLISGTADLVLRTPDGAIVLDDHKTSGKGWKKNKETPRQKGQAPFYIYAWWLATKEMPERFTYSVMTYEGKFDRKPVTPTTAEIMATVRKAQVLQPVLELAKQGLELPGNTSHFLCREEYCDHWFRCPFGAAMNN